MNIQTYWKLTAAFARQLHGSVALWNALWEHLKNGVPEMRNQLVLRMLSCNWRLTTIKIGSLMQETLSHIIDKNVVFRIVFNTWFKISFMDYGITHLICCMVYRTSCESNNSLLPRYVLSELVADKTAIVCGLLASFLRAHHNGSVLLFTAL